MKTLRLPLRAVYYREGNDWVVHCLEFDLAGHGATREQAREQLREAIEVQIEASSKYLNQHNLFSPADGEWFAKFAAGMENHLSKTFRIKKNNVVIESLQTRVFTGVHAAVSA